MRIKTFEAPTMQEALILARMELGDEAVVLNTKQVKSGGLLGLRGSNKVELMAAIDDAPAVPSVPASPLMAGASVTNTVVAVEERPIAVDRFAPPQSPLASRLYSGASAPVDAGQSDFSEVKQLRTELRELNALVQGWFPRDPSKLRSDSINRCCSEPALTRISPAV